MDGDRREDELEGTCAACGAPLDPDDSRNYGFGDQCICWACAEKRGGRYSRDRDTWVSAPNVADLRGADEDDD